MKWRMQKAGIILSYSLPRESQSEGAVKSGEEKKKITTVVGNTRKGKEKDWIALA